MSAASFAGQFDSFNEKTSSSICFGILLLVAAGGQEFIFDFHATLLNKQKKMERASPDNLFCQCIVVALEIGVGIFFSLLACFLFLSLPLFFKIKI